MVKKTVVEVVGNLRKMKNGDFEYEVRFFGERNIADGMYLPGKALSKQGWDKDCKAIDQRIAQTLGLAQRALSATNVEKYIQEVATHSRMGALSGGQKVKIVLAAALWNEPHILILDEPGVLTILLQYYWSQNNNTIIEGEIYF
jgi:elongation factor 3